MREWHYKQLRERQKYNKSSKDRKGGISKDAFKGLSKSERKEMAKAGLAPSNRFWANMHDQKKGRNRNSKWEAAAWEMGMGRVKDSDDLKKLWDRHNELGIKDFDSYGDVAQFRKKVDQKAIDEMVNKGIESRWAEWIKGKEAERSAQGEASSGLEPQVLPGAEDWNSPYMDVIKQLTEQLSSNQMNNPYVQGPRQGWQPQGGWAYQ